MHIGIFDSGIGGEAIARSLQVSLPRYTISVVNDSAHLPYGEKTSDDIRQLTDNAIQPLLKVRCDVIVLACNTATTAAIDWIQEKYPRQQFIGVEPMIDAAADITKTGTIGVCATAATLASERYNTLKKPFMASHRFIEPDCSEWANLIEANTINHSHIKAVIDIFSAQNVDTIVLGCTHYHWIKEDISLLAGNGITVLEPSDSVTNRVRELLSSIAD